jgi:hypothetical protein
MWFLLLDAQVPEESWHLDNYKYEIFKMCDEPNAFAFHKIKLHWTRYVPISAVGWCVENGKAKDPLKSPEEVGGRGGWWQLQSISLPKLVVSNWELWWPEAKCPDRSESHWSAAPLGSIRGLVLVWTSTEISVCHFSPVLLYSVPHSFTLENILAELGLEQQRTVTAQAGTVP